MLVVVFLVLIVLSCSAYVGVVFPVLIILSCCAYGGDCISCLDCFVLFCLCWWLYILSWLSFLVLSMLVIVFLVWLSCLFLPILVIIFLVLIVLSCSTYVGDCISCPDCLVLFSLCWWLYFLSWLSCLVLSMLVIVFLVLIVLSYSAYVGDCISFGTIAVRSFTSLVTLYYYSDNLWIVSLFIQKYKHWYFHVNIHRHLLLFVFTFERKTILKIDTSMIPNIMWL
jgi:hypothetical protein